MSTDSPIRLPDPREPDYLWDGSGTPDPEVARLESLLGGLRYRSPAPVEAPPPVVQIHVRATPAPAPPARWPQRFAAAAMIGLAALAGYLCPLTSSPYDVEALSGTPTVSHAEVGRGRALRPGEWLRTDAGSRARIQVAAMGDVTVEPRTSIRVRTAPQGQRLLELRQGTIHAFITAPPRMFMVDTPAARAIDLGCEYTLTVDESGAGRLRVLLGYVQLEWKGLTSTIPMNGGVCLIRPGRGPGTPFFDDASERLKTELERFDFDAGGEAALNAVLSEARAKDALSLWHLIQRAEPELRGVVYDRLSQLKSPPEGVTRTGILALDRGMLDTWWNEMRPF